VELRTFSGFRKISTRFQGGLKTSAPEGIKSCASYASVGSDDVEVGLILGEAAGASNKIVNPNDSRTQKPSLTAEGERK
jgi:hypothetical protein